VRLAAEENRLPVSEGIPTLSYALEKEWPHDRGAFIEGLVFWDGLLIESTGLNGKT
jgi:glutamine cyclotransferase